MDVNTLRTLVTVVCFLVFVAIVVWAWGGARRRRFDEAARVPLDEDTHTEPHLARVNPDEARK